MVISFNSASEAIREQKILITGGFGFIGSSLARILNQNQNDIVLLDICPPEGSAAAEMGLFSKEGITYRQGSILDETFVNSLDTDFDYIIHAAGILGIKKVAEYPLLTAEVNVFGTKKILDFAAKQSQLKRFVLFSTSEIYGQHSHNVHEEADSVIPNTGMRWVYASGKHFTEYLLKSFIKEHGLPGVIVRPFNVYGPYRKGSNAVTAIIENALAGNDIHLSGDGQQTRAWCYIDDFIQGIIQCMSVENIIGEAFNIGNNDECISMADLAEKICFLLHSHSKIKILGWGNEDVRERSPDISKARRILGYTPAISLDTGLIQVAEYIKCSSLIGCS